MKKIITLVTCMFMMASVMAKDYTGLMTIDLGMGDPTEQDATISLTNESEKYTLTLVDFSFSGLSLGDISISDLENTATEEGTVTLTYDGNIKTEFGELPGTIDLSVNNEDVMTATITISVMGMSIVVTFDSSKSISDPVTSSYTGLMIIKSGTETLSEQNATIDLTNESGIYTLTLVDFSFGGLSLGDISISDLENTATEEGTVTLTYDGNIKTEFGELPGTIDLSVNNEDVMTATITISVMGMSIVVTFDSSTTTGITKVSTTDSESSVIEIYNLQGQKVTDTNRPGIYILRKADGTATKRYVR